jgi:hypothetical protein
MLPAATSPTAGLPLALVTPGVAAGGVAHMAGLALMALILIAGRVRWRGNESVLHEEAARPVPAMRGHEGHAAGRLPLAMVMRTGCG